MVNNDVADYCFLFVYIKQILPYVLLKCIINMHYIVFIVDAIILGQYSINKNEQKACKTVITRHLLKML